MEIRVSTNLKGHVAQNQFQVKTVDGYIQKLYSCNYEAGDWSFKMFDHSQLVLESRQKPLPGGKGFWNYQEYLISWQDQEIGLLKKSYIRKELVADGMSLSFPKLSKRHIAPLNLKFPLRSLLYRFRVCSFCQAAEPEKIMLAIAMTVYVWFTWNALSAD